MIIMVALPVFLASCEQKDQSAAEPCEYCFGNPLMDLPWLKTIVDEFEKDAIALQCNQHARIYRCTYKDSTGFLIEMCGGCQGAEYRFRNYEGAVLWEGVELPGEDLLFELDIDAESLELIWERMENFIFEKHNLKPIEIVEDEQGNEVDKETGVLRYSNTVNFKSDKTEINEIALDYMQKNREILGLSSNLEEIEFSQESSTESIAWFNQYLHNIPVRLGYIAFIIRNNGVTMVYNRIRFLNHYAVDSAPSITDSEALRTAYKCVSRKYGFTVDVPTTRLVYFESEDKGLELAWEIVFSEYRGQAFYVSATNGRIIHIGPYRTI